MSEITVKMENSMIVMVVKVVMVVMLESMLMLIVKSDSASL